jgi:hypothetical protein
VVWQVLWKLEDLGESELRALAALSEPEARDALAGKRLCFVLFLILKKGLEGRGGMKRGGLDDRM